jgi:hypothetical protein
MEFAGLALSQLAALWHVTSGIAERYIRILYSRGRVELGGTPAPRITLLP